MGRILLVFACLLGLSAGAQAQNDDTSSQLRAQQVLSATRAGQEGSVACDRLAGLGQPLIALGKEVGGSSTDRAVIAFRLAERAGRCAGSEPLLGAALTELSAALLGVGSLDASLAAAKESVELLGRLNDRTALASAWNALGNVHWWLNEMDAALDDFRHSVELSTAAGDRVGEARTLNNIANVLKYRGEYDAALERYSRADRVLEEAGDLRRAATVVNNIALTYSLRGDTTTALEYNRRALDMARATGNQSMVAKALDTGADLYRVMGAHDLALRSFQEALRIRASMGDKLGVMETTLNIGLVHYSQGDYDLAIAAFKDGIRLNREGDLRDDVVVAEGLRDIGAAAWRLGQRERAAADFRESLEIMRRTGQRYREAEVLNDLGQMSLADGRVAESSRLLDESLAIRQALGDQAGISETLTSLASARLAGHHNAAALELAERARDNAAAHDQPELRWQAQTVAAAACIRLGRTDAAKQALIDAIRSIEQVSGRLAGTESLRLRFFEDKLSPYHELIALLIQQRSFGEALELAERSKARVLTRLLGTTQDDHAGILSSEEKREQTRLRDALRAVDQQIARGQESKSADQARLTALEATRRSARDAVAAFETVLLARHPELATVRGQVAPLTVPDAGRLLTDRATAVVEYVVSNDRLFAFLATTDGTRVALDARALPVDRATLIRRVEHFRVAVSTRDFGFVDEARALYDTLLSPFGARLAGLSRIIMVPDGPLWNVPFQALRSPDGFVIEHAAVSYAPSLTALREIRGLPRPALPRTLFAMAKSDFAGTPGLEPLPDAEAQVRLIRDAYGPERSATFVGADATETRFKAAAPRYSVLHLATHGVLDETSPLYSHLVFTPSHDTADDDGRLEAWEIMRMKLDADLVVLAACDTGRGRIAPGEGVIGTMWALFAAGARSMVVSQFRVESKSATTLLVGLHRRLAAERGSKAAQLRAAALDMLHTPRYAHPYYWAGFILVGDAD
jgi:CHAT domain-containing protein/Tfp pilus assembly protein PilF